MGSINCPVFWASGGNITKVSTEEGFEAETPDPDPAKNSAAVPPPVISFPSKSK